MTQLKFSTDLNHSGLHARRRLDEGRMPIYGTGWLGRYYKWRRDRLHESTRPPGATKPTEAQELTRPNDPYPGIQEVDGHVTEATFARGTVEMEAAQTGAGAYPFRERRKSVVVNVEPVELPAGERESMS